MELYNFPYQQYLKTELPENIQHLVMTAEKAAQKAYAPYSNLKVGSAILMTDDSIAIGFNQENAAFPSGNCAERAALGSLDISESNTIKAIAVTYQGEDSFEQKPISPCGMCRQSLIDAQHRQKSPIAVYMCSPSGQVIMVESAEYLLPFSFGSDILPGFKPQV